MPPSRILRSAVLPATTLLLAALGASAAPLGAQSPAAVLADSPPAKVAPEAARLREWHDLAAGRLHPAGSKGDLELVEEFSRLFADMGLEVERHEIWPYIGKPVAARLSLVAPVELSLPLKEAPVEGDTHLPADELSIGWNAYSGSGRVEAEVVYANYGTKADFARLRELGIDCAGKIVIARYGGNFRGYKATYAERAGAAGLILFTDPKDAGYGRGLEYPEGGWANGTSIQRGSILVLPWAGDPLTPGVAATRDAERLDPATLPLPTIPVQPVGWTAAKEILGRMKGPEVPGPWQGGLPFRYRLEGGPGVRVRLEVEQERKQVRTYNVVATLPGREDPDREIVFGCHHDAWTWGANDPTAGVITVLEAARVLAAEAAAGRPPRRTIRFALWGAEEHGIIGSTEWVEARADRLRTGAVAYVNLDGAAMGPSFSAASSPSLHAAIAAAAGRTPQLGAEGRSVLDDWIARGTHPGSPSLPRFGDLGGGSDHVAFLCHVGVPCAGAGASGSSGNAYHTAYDNLAWYRKVVGDDYGPAVMVTRFVIELARELADAPILRLSLAHPSREARRHLRDLSRRAVEIGLAEIPEGKDVIVPLLRIDLAALLHERRAALIEDRIAEAQASDRISPELGREIDGLLIAADRAWIDPEGLPERPWFRNLYAASDEDSGYAAWLLPVLRRAIDRGDAEALAAAEARHVAVFERLDAILDRLESLIPEAGAPR